MNFKMCVDLISFHSKRAEETYFHILEVLILSDDNNNGTNYGKIWKPPFI